jgi:hypothetical protein
LLGQAVARSTVDQTPDGYQGQAFKALGRAIHDAGELPSTAGENIPLGVKCVTKNLWRQYWRNETTADPGENERSSWRSALLGLKNKKLIGNWGEWYWIVRS